MNPERSGENPRHEREPRPDSARIYAASLSDYNNGRLHGAWIDADQDREAIGEAIEEMLASSHFGPAEEFAIHDYDGFGPVRLSEYESLEDIAKLGQGIAEHGQAYAYLAAHLDRAEWYLLDRFEDLYLGHWTSAGEYAEQFLEDIGIDLDGIGPELLQPYITLDLDAFARDLADDYLMAEDPDGGVYVFQRE